MSRTRKSDPPAKRLEDRAARDAAIMLDALRPIESDPEVAAVWTETLGLALRGEDVDAFRVSFTRLVSMIERAAPSFARFADEGLPQVLFAMVMSRVLQASGLAPAVAQKQAAASAPPHAIRVSPDNPILIRPDGSAAFRPSDKKRDQDEVLEFLEELRPRPRTGRPKGSRDWTREDFVPACREAYRREGALRKPRRPSRERVAERLGMSTNTLRVYLDLYGVSWPPE